MACVNWDPRKYGISFDEFVEETRVSKNNVMWLYKMWDHLRTEYEDKWVAVNKDKIIGANENQDALIEDIESMGYSISEVEIRYITPKDIIEIL